MMNKAAEIREKALKDMQHSEVLMRDGHFDYGNGYHGRVYLNPHQLFRHPSTIWRFAQDLIDLMPSDLLEQTQVVAGPSTGGALLAHTIAGLLDSRRSLTHPACSFAPFHVDVTPGSGRSAGVALRAFYRREIHGKRVLLVDDIRNTGETFAKCAALVKDAGGTVLATAEICDRCEATVNLGVPNIALVDYPAPDNYKAAGCPLCAAGTPITQF
jgi:orotate phosphoribosyltransferase